MRTSAILERADVLLVAEAAEAEALSNGWAVSIAIVDHGGHLLALNRLDGAAPATAHIARAALQAAAPAARLVQIGDRADRRIALSGALLRGKGTTIMGFRQDHAPRQLVVDVYRQMAEHVMTGRLHIEVERHALSDVAEHWGRSARRKLVLIP
jgi:hypothetical protein